MRVSINIVRHKQVSEKKLNEIVRLLEQERAGIIAPRIQRDAAQRPLENHLDDYLADLSGRQLSRGYIYNVEKRLRRLFRECNWQRHADATADSFTAWRSQQSGAAATTKNQYLEACSAFFGWLKGMKRLFANPFEDVGRVEEQGNEQRKRRAYGDEQLRALLAVAGSFRVGYLAAVHTGLRRAELKALEWQNVNLSIEPGNVWLPDEHTKNGKPANLPLHAELASEFRRVKSADAQPTDRVFSNRTLPSIYMVKKHLAQAGIPYKDAEGKQADFHALRHRLSTNLAKTNVPPRVTMEMMRHSDIRLTMKTYTDAARLPLAEALKGMPNYLPNGGEDGVGEKPTADGTQIRTQTPDFQGQEPARAGTNGESGGLPQVSQNHELGRKLSRFDATMHERQVAALLGFEPRQNDSESFVLPLHHKAKMEGRSYGCAAACK